MSNKLYTIEKCPICSNAYLEDYLKTKDFTFSKEEFVIQKCSECGFRFTNPIPTEDNIGEYYKSDDYLSHSTAKRKGIIPLVYRKVRAINLKKKLKLLKKVSSGKRILDIGAGNGFFLSACRSAGYDVKGLEPDSHAREVADKDYGIELNNIDHLNKIASGSLDIVTMWHVLEHVYHLRKDVEDIVRVLSDDGVLILALPNIDSYDAQYYMEHWDGLDLPLHLYHFTPTDVKNLFEQYGMELVEMKPMKFDSYWVSLNSEKFKGGNMIKGFYIGWKSNMRAKNGFYSSQTYVLKKKQV
jgi:SAM-dependent methyltransferase